MTTKTPRRASPTALVAAFLLAALVALGAAVWIVTELREESEGPERAVTLQQVIDDPGSFAGERVTVSGDVASTHRRPRAFAIGDDLDRPALVLLPPRRSLASWPDPDDVARVTGTVGIFRFAEYAKGLDDVDLAGDDPFFGAFEGDAVIVADRIEILEEGTTSPVLEDQG